MVNSVTVKLLDCSTLATNQVSEENPSYPLQDTVVNHPFTPNLEEKLNAEERFEQAKLAVENGGDLSEVAKIHNITDAGRFGELRAIAVKVQEIAVEDLDRKINDLEAFKRRTHNPNLVICDHQQLEIFMELRELDECRAIAVKRLEELRAIAVSARPDTQNSLKA